MARTILEKTNPNKHGWVKLIKFDEDDVIDEHAVYYVTSPDSPEDGCEFDGDYAAAKRYFDETVKELKETPNWELQAAYDEMHGTDNGYASFQFNREY